MCARCTTPPDVVGGVEKDADAGSIVLRDAAIEPGERNFHLAVCTLGSKHVVNGPAEFIRDKISNDLHAVAGFARRYE